MWVQVIEEAFQAVMAREPERLRELQAKERQAKKKAELEQHKKRELKRWAYPLIVT